MRCAVYVRVSTDMDSQKSSIAHQKNYFIKYLMDKGWTLYNIYEDKESGMSVDKREGLKKLIQDSNNNLFDIILTKSISRFARNTLEGLQYIREFRRKNIRFITIEDAFDSEEYDEFMFTLLLSMAQKESEKISERIRFGKKERAKKGYFNGSHPPYGYKKKGKDLLEPAEDVTTEVVKLIFKMYVEGKGFYSIAKHLNHRGYPTPSQVLNKPNSSNIWHQSTIKNILTNEVYQGDMVQNKTKTKDVLKGIREYNDTDKYIEVKNTHKGIITPQVFNEVQNIMTKRAINRSGNNKHLFTNIIFCKECGSAMHYKKNRGAYICGKQNKMGKEYCEGAYINERKLKEQLVQDLEERVKNHVSLATINNTLMKELKSQGKKKGISSLDNQFKLLNKKEERLLDIYIGGHVNKESYKRKRASLVNQRLLLQDKKNKLELELKSLQFHFNSLDEVVNYVNFDIAFEKLISRIEVNADHLVKVYYNFKDL